MTKLFQVIYESAELLVVNKPAGLVCHPTKGDAFSSLISRVRLHLGESSHPQLVNRLDRETSGVTVIAKDAQTARALRRLWEERKVQKEYVALVHGNVPDAHGLIDAPLGKDERSAVAIKDCVRSDGVPALTEYWVEQRLPRPQKPKSEEEIQERSQSPGPVICSVPRQFTMLRVVPHTGRKHQIRIHLAHIGHPIVGDKLYGGDEDLYMALVEDRLTAAQRAKLILPNHALHAREVRFTWHGREEVFRTEPDSWVV